MWQHHRNRRDVGAAFGRRAEKCQSHDSDGRSDDDDDEDDDDDDDDDDEYHLATSDLILHLNYITHRSNSQNRI